MTTLNFFDSTEFSNGLKLSSASEATAKMRQHVYFSAIENLNTLESIHRRLQNFDGSAQLDAAENLAPAGMGVALAEASIKAQINSIVGYVAIERAMTQMNQMLVYTDVITKTGAKVMPNVGPDSPRDRSGKIYESVLEVGTTDYSVVLAGQTVAGSIAITVKLDGKTYAMMDDRQGNILAPAGVITAGSINYYTGKLDLTFANATVADDSIRVCYALNKLLAEGNNRTTVRQGYFNINAKVNKFEFEADLITAMISQKTVGDDVIAQLQQSVQDEQILSINNNLVNTLRLGYVGDTVKIDLSAFSVAGGFFESLLKVLNAGLAEVDNRIAAKCYKQIAATAYVVGNGASTLFMSLEDAQGWVANNTGYVNDVIGFYKSRAVIRNLNLDDYECYGIAKTVDGKLAPLGYGILLPATNLPLVGNFANTNEVASGIYSVDGTAPVEMQLAQRFELVMPADWMIRANA